jgi:disulfide oxidoreductase YuzD
VVYRNVDSEETKAAFSETISKIESQGLLYPVTIVDGVPLYDGTVSYPAIMRAVHNKLVERQEAQ